MKRIRVAADQWNFELKVGEDFGCAVGGCRRAPSRSGVALLITLLFLALITIIAVAFLGTMTWEMSAAKRNYENQKARALAMVGMNTAVAQLRQALDAWDNPYQNFATNPPSFYWSVSPGILTRWSYTNVAPLTNYPLFSIDPSGANNLVNLNAAQSDGTYPIAGGASAPNISVYWTPVLKNPASTTASAGNPIIGRYAFWVDDENAKININTADGTLKYKTNSLGLGSPSEVSLQVLQANTNSLAPATNIVYLARTAGFNSVREILRATNATSDIYTNNVFNLTTYSRSPDLNIFGQPKMALTTFLGDASMGAYDMLTNSITLQAAREIYPTPSQLPPYMVACPVNTEAGYPDVVGWTPPTPQTPAPIPWPLAFRGVLGPTSTGGGTTLNPGDDSWQILQWNYPWINGMMLAQYLGGTNSAYRPITWPPFPDPSGITAGASGGFTGKYSLRQIDSLVAQIASLGSKDISPDYCFTTNNPNYGNPPAPVNSALGMRAFTVPFLFNGWLSHQWVSGMGRVPKVESMELAFTTYGSVGVPTDYNNTNGYLPPRMTVMIHQEWWMPAAYLGGTTVAIPGFYTGGLGYGIENCENMLNTADLYQSSWPSPVPAQVPNATNGPSYWANQLLQNNQGMDFANNTAPYSYTNTGVG